MTERAQYLIAGMEDLEAERVSSEAYDWVGVTQSQSGVARHQWYLQAGKKRARQLRTSGMTQLQVGMEEDRRLQAVA